MSRMHILEADTDGNYRVVCHFNTPGGSNSAGVLWKTAGINSGKLGSTVMTEGTGAGQISTAEKASVIAGDVCEVVATVKAESGGTSSISLTEIFTSVKSKFLADMQIQLKYFGAVLS